jgi:hypothetical protein
MWWMPAAFPAPARGRGAGKAAHRAGRDGAGRCAADAGQRYGSEAAVDQTEKWMQAIARAAYLASVDLARKRGPSRCLMRQISGLGHACGMDADVRDAIRRQGHPQRAADLHRAHGHDQPLCRQRQSSGIEPVFAYAYKRKVLQPDGSRTEEEVVDYAVQPVARKVRRRALPDHFVNAQTLAPLDHVRMQAAAQKWVDSSIISKTINCPEDISFDDFKEVYMAAWDQGCKGCTTYRPNDVTGSVLTVSEEAEITPSEAPAQMQGGEVVYLSEPLDRPAALEGQTYKLKWPGSANTRSTSPSTTSSSRPPPPVRGVHQLQEHGAFRLDRGADADDLGGVPARGGYLFRGRGTEGRVRPARRGVDGGAVYPLDPGGHRRGDRAAPVAIGFIDGEGHGPEIRPQGRGGCSG